MRKLLITLGILAVCGLITGAGWIFGGRELSLFVDRFKTIETTSRQIKSLVYEGHGTGGILHCDGLDLSLNSATTSPEPNIGTTKDDQLALSFEGKVFPLGPVLSGAETLSCETPAGDTAIISTRRSVLSWPGAFPFSFLSGKAPSWKRHIYRRLAWTKQGGGKLEMTWRYEQHFYPEDGWTDALMTSEDSPGLIRVDISPADR